MRPNLRTREWIMLFCLSWSSAKSDAIQNGPYVRLNIEGGFSTVIELYQEHVFQDLAANVGLSFAL